VLAITYRRVGERSEIVGVNDVGEAPPPGPARLQVQVSAFRIHSGDPLAIAATQTAGRTLSARIEATGVITAIGDGSRGFEPGERGTTFSRLGARRQAVDVGAAIAVPVPDGAPDGGAVCPLQRLAGAVRHVTQPGKVDTIVVKP
jgi:NADPH2:quinone reductase